MFCMVLGHVEFFPLCSKCLNLKVNENKLASINSFYLKFFWKHFYMLLVNFLRRRQWHPIPVLLPGKSHGLRSLVGCCPWGHQESDTTEPLHFHFPLSCIGGGNGNPLQYSCLENPRDGGAWWAAVCGVTQSRTRLTRLSSSSIPIIITSALP